VYRGRRDETDLDRVWTGCDGRRKNIADVYQLGGRPATPGSAVAPGLTHSSSPYIIVLLLYYTEFSHTKYYPSGSYNIYIYIYIYAYIFFHLYLGVQTNVYRLLTEFRLTRHIRSAHTPIIRPTSLRRTILYIMASSRSHCSHHTRRHRIPRNHGQFKYYWSCTIYTMSP